MRISLSGPQDILALLVRRKWWVIAPFLALTCASALLTYLLPKTFVSETLILVRPRDVPKDFVRDLISESAGERLRTIQQTILSRTNLVQISNEFGDRLPDFARLNMDDRVIKLRGQINIMFEADRRNGADALTYFKISYQNQDPELAQRIASKLTTLFVEQDNKVRETQVFGTTEFLSTELSKVAEQLQESETKLKEYKRGRQYELPDQKEVNLRALDRLGLDKRSNAEAVDRYATIRLNLEKEIAETPPTLPKPDPPAPVLARAATNPELSAKIQQYRKAQEEYDELSIKYTLKHPEVQMAEARLEHAKKQLPPEVLAAAISGALAEDETDASPIAGTSKSTDSGIEANPAYKTLLAKLAEVNKEFEYRDKDRGFIDSQIAKYTARVESIPKTEQEMADAARQSEDLKKQYDDLKDKLAQARLSESLESKQKGSQFVVVDPPNLPLAPSKPNKPTVLLGAAAMSLLISIAFAIVVDVARQKIWTQSQIEAMWGLPVLVDIPEILTDSDLIALRKKKYIYAALSAAGAVAWSICLYGVYLKHAFILEQLDPVLQKFVYK
jgi:polysaccharide chain length determinant protein (PEP-CTERM system associated)